MLCAITMIAYSAPPVVVKDVGKQKDEQVMGDKFVASTTCFSSASIQIINELEYRVTAPVAKAADADVAVPIQKSSKPLPAGLAIRMRRHCNFDLINLVIASTSGHRILHVDPGLC